MNLRLEQAWAQLQETGIPDFTTPACPDYQDNMIDVKAVDWDMAFKEVEDGEQAKNE